MAKVDPSRDIPNANSSSATWINWHKTLRKFFNKKEANAIWVYAWSKRGGIDNESNDRTLSKYMEKQGVDIARSDLDEIGEGFLDFRDGLLSIGKWMIIIPLGIAGVIMLLIIIQLFRSPKKSMNTAMMLTPQGRALGVAKGIKGK